MRIIIDLPPEQAVRARAVLGGEEEARRLLLRLLSSVLDAAAPVAPKPYLLDTRPEIPAAMSLAGDPIRLHLRDQPAENTGHEQADGFNAEGAGEEGFGAGGERAAEGAEGNGSTAGN